MSNYKTRVYEILDLNTFEDKTSKVVDIILISLISLNVLAVILETVPQLSAYSYHFYVFEVFSITIFTAEYVLRLWSSSSQKDFSNRFTGRFKFAATPFAIIDLVAILPFFIPLVFAIDLRVVRILRFLRIIRILKVGRYSESMKTLGNVLKSKKEELAMIIFVAFILLVFSSSVMYFAEHDAQPKVFASIPHSMWWGVVTLTTVGYGDVYPVTLFGKILSALISFLGIGMFALPAGILASGYSDEMQNKRKKLKTVCPNCQTELNEVQGIKISSS